MGDDAEEELLSYAALSEAVTSGLGKFDTAKHSDDVDYVVRQALAAGCATPDAAGDWLTRQLIHCRKSGFVPPNAKYFPEPPIAQLVKYLRFAEQARATG